MFEDMVKKFHVYKGGKSLTSWVAIILSRRIVLCCLFELVNVVSSISHAVCG